MYCCRVVVLLCCCVVLSCCRVVLFLRCIVLVLLCCRIVVLSWFWAAGCRHFEPADRSIPVARAAAVKSAEPAFGKAIGHQLPDRPGTGSGTEGWRASYGISTEDRPCHRWDRRRWGSCSLAQPNAWDYPAWPVRSCGRAIGSDQPTDVSDPGRCHFGLPPVAGNTARL